MYTHHPQGREDSNGLLSRHGGRSEEARDGRSPRDSCFLRIPFPVLLASRFLDKNRAEEPLPEDQVRRIILDVCAGMAFLHGKETVHGDLKSANILLDGTGRAKVRCYVC